MDNFPRENVKTFSVVPLLSSTNTHENVRVPLWTTSSGRVTELGVFLGYFVKGGRVWSRCSLSFKSLKEFYDSDRSPTRIPIQTDLGPEDGNHAVAAFVHTKETTDPWLVVDRSSACDVVGNLSLLNDIPYCSNHISTIDPLTIHLLRR